MQTLLEPLNFARSLSKFQVVLKTNLQTTPYKTHEPTYRIKFIQTTTTKYYLE